MNNNFKLFLFYVVRKTKQKLIDIPNYVSFASTFNIELQAKFSTIIIE